MPGADPLWPLLVYAAAVLSVVSIMVGLSWVLGERHKDRATGEPYEGGTLAEGTARLRFPAKFYLVAMSFVIFDLEAVFIFAWGAAFRRVGWAGYVGLLVFVAILLMGLVYEWRLGMLDWASSARKQRKAAGARAAVSLQS
jgi:NADH-quinone oxidoreductase subunit A